LLITALRADNDYGDDTTCSPGYFMRKDRNTGKVYKNFRDWLFHGHSIWIILIFFAYGWYLGSTDEVK
jgi:hypothetical protein